MMKGYEDGFFIPYAYLGSTLAWKRRSYPQDPCLWSMNLGVCGYHPFGRCGSRSVSRSLRRHPIALLPMDTVNKRDKHAHGVEFGGSSLLWHRNVLLLVHSIWSSPS